MMMLSLPSNCVLPASLAALCSLLAVNMLQMRGGNTSLKSDIERGRSDDIYAYLNIYTYLHRSDLRLAMDRSQDCNKLLEQHR